MTPSPIIYLLRVSHPLSVHSRWPSVCKGLAPSIGAVLLLRQIRKFLPPEDLFYNGIYTIFFPFEWAFGAI